MKLTNFTNWLESNQGKILLNYKDTMLFEYDNIRYSLESEIIDKKKFYTIATMIPLDKEKRIYKCEKIVNDTTRKNLLVLFKKNLIN